MNSNYIINKDFEIIRSTFEARIVEYLLRNGGSIDLSKLSQKLHVSKRFIFRICKNSPILGYSKRKNLVYLKNFDLLHEFMALKQKLNDLIKNENGNK